MKKFVIVLMILCTFTVWGEFNDVVWKCTATPYFEYNKTFEINAGEHLDIQPGKWFFSVNGKNKSNTVLYSGSKSLYVNESETNVTVPVTRNEHTVTSDGTEYGNLNISIVNKDSDSVFFVEYGLIGESTGIIKCIDSGNEFVSSNVKSGYYWIRCYSNDYSGGTACCAWVIAGEDCNVELNVNLNSRKENIWVAVSSYESIVSYDSVVWNVFEQDITSPWSSIFASDAGMFSFGNGIISYSVDGKTWEETAGYNASQRYSAGCVFNNNVFCCSYDGSIAFSEDGRLWSVLSIADENISWKAIESGCGKIAVCGYKMEGSKMYPCIAFSSDSVNWTVSLVGEGFSINNICCTGNAWVACGGDGHIIVFDSNGAIVKDNKVGSSSWNDVCYGNGMCLVVGNKSIAKTGDLNEWSTTEMSGVSMKACCFADEKWAIASSYSILCSNDCFDTYSCTEIQSNYPIKDIYAL